MKESLKIFVTDYIDLGKHSIRWLQKHWKGYLVFCILAFVGRFAYGMYKMIKKQNLFDEATNETFEQLNHDLNEES